MENKLYQALLARYNAQIQSAEANLLVYFKSPSGVGEHPDVVGEMSRLVDQIAVARGALEVLQMLAQANQAEQGEEPAAPVDEPGN